MAVFISHSHQDADFVDTLAANLVRSNQHVWVDRWELNVGDSLIQRIQDAMESATAIVFVLSKASVQSEWCRKELSVGLLRELEKRRVVVLPVLKEDCDIPLFLRDKKYADFRRNFDSGLDEVQAALAKATNSSLGRTDEAGWFTDWSTKWRRDGPRAVVLEFTAIEQSKEQRYTTLTMAEVFLNEVASARFCELTEAGHGEVARQLVLSALGVGPIRDNLDVVLESAEPTMREALIRDPGAGLEYRIKLTCRRLGEDTGHPVLLHVGWQLAEMAKQSEKMLRRSPIGSTESFLRIMKKYRKSLPFGG